MRWLKSIPGPLFAMLLTLSVSILVCDAQVPGDPSSIPARKIVSLEKELSALDAKRSSAVRARRACKNIVRDGETLLKTYPAAPNRYRVLAIILESQKRLLGLDNSVRNRAALFATCGELAKAPDDYAKLRLEADLLLSEKALTESNADLKERAQALSGIVQNYRDTPGEGKSLKMAALIAPKLEAWDLEEEIQNVMDDRFMDDPDIIEFRRKFLGPRRLDALFKGTFSRIDGTTISFPVDRLGHLCIMVFWSSKTPGFEKALKQIAEHDELYPNRFEFFSFNVDEMPDGGAAILKEMDLDWTLMRLPGGKSSQTFRTYAQREPVGLFVNAYGHALLNPTKDYGRGHTAVKNPYKIDRVRISEDRYLAQMQSLFNGDFLVSDAGDSFQRDNESVPAERFDAIQACFVEAPFRYRLSRDETMELYQKAERLSREALAQHPQASDLWRVRDRRIIALIGMWKLLGEPKYLQDAVEEARKALKTSRPAGAAVVPMFCLAKDALRQAGADSSSIISGLIEATGGSEAPGSAHAAAAILALDAGSRELHNHHREILLARHGDDPKLWQVTAFLRDRYHIYHLLEANYIRSERRWTRSHLINHGFNTSTNRFPDIEFKKLDGGTFNLPKANEGELTLLLFIELPADPTAELPIKIGGVPAEGKQKERPGVMQFAFEMADRHVHDEVKVVLAFLSDDTDRIKSMMNENGWPGEAVQVEGGLENPLVRRLGILSADRIPNVFLLRRDGTVAWTISGLEYRSDFGFPFAIRLAMKVHVEVCDTQLAYKALKSGDFKEAARVFSGPFLAEKDERYRWTGPRFHGRALAHVGLLEWELALADIEKAMEAHDKEFEHAKDRPCESMDEMQRLKGSILEKLGRDEDAEAARARAELQGEDYPETIYEQFHGMLGELRKD